MNIQNIGKGQFRCTVGNARTRERLARVQGITVEGERVIFPRWMASSVEVIVRRGTRRRKEVAVQMRMGL